MPLLHSSRPGPPVPAGVERSLRLSVLDGLLYAVMVGASESYLGAFAVDLGHGNTALALLATVPLLLGAVSQLLSPLWVLLLGSRQRAVVGGALVQVVSLLWMLQIAAVRDGAFAGLLLAKAVFWVAGGVITPPWNAWMGTLTAEVDREHYFARRSALIHLVLLVAFVASGLALARDAHVYAVLFGVAAVARMLGAIAIAFKLDPAAATARPREQMSRRMRRAITRGHYRTAVFIGLLMFGAHVSIPFFTPYMLRTLSLGKFDYAALTAVSILAKAACFPLWRRVAKRRGMGAVLLPSTAIVCALPLLWTFARGAAELSALQALSGVAWSGFEYATLQLLLRDAPEDADVEFFALANSFAGVMQLLGSLVGSALLLRPGFDYHAAFVLSSALRTLALLVLALGLLRLSLVAPARALFTRVLSVRPGGGAVSRLITTQDRPSDGDDPQCPSGSGR